jgi:hypothetical protein
MQLDIISNPNFTTQTLHTQSDITSNPALTTQTLHTQSDIVPDPTFPTQTLHTQLDIIPDLTCNGSEFMLLPIFSDITVGNGPVAGKSAGPYESNRRRSMSGLTRATKESEKSNRLDNQTGPIKRIMSTTFRYGNTSVSLTDKVEKIGGKKRTRMHDELQAQLFCIGANIHSKL